MPKFIVTVKRVVEEKIDLEVEAESEEVLLQRIEEVRTAATDDFDDCWEPLQTIKVVQEIKHEPSDGRFGDEDPEITLHPDGRITVFGD